ncbi:bacterial cytochrome ubiquinol oxidase, subunit 1 family protein [Teredinibacter turnerae T7901]|uniref:Bacterial cytochrome ubiquinol oxidase, subunit 1 family protein n=1 Tax=Teredinibacter turnerae (strain ATCC 39867 / T7901) TaxID=377629 RepID=C5BM65_TERTT|nr:cytochrome ubiquinol oxidase subunit I [Teredinibacter turnerae]ACR12208.1 bacterial cytochrome ubiquinol oxidase, subunit 1 family protein [Teredinibacter turnerae T7901]
MLDTLELSRIQFAANISFHILFPTINIAMCWVLFFFKIRHDMTQNPVWMRAYRFWVKVFALTFALGVVSGITMSFQFGTNWPGFMETVGNIAGPLLGYEVLTAFFLEATFLGVMLFGINRVPPKLHTLATLLVALGTTMSAFWILALNSWMHTPAGFEMREGVAHVTSWWEVIFNPSFPYRLMHMLVASGLTAAFFVAGISAYRIRKGDTKRAPLLALKTGIFMAAVLMPLQILVGDLHGLNTFEHQPQKVSAMEGVWHTEQGAPLLLFAIPDEEAQKNHWEIGIPHMASLILTHTFNGEITGLTEFEAHPPVKPLFFGFRVMVGVGLLMLATAWFTSLLLLKNKTLPYWLLRHLEVMTFSGWVATLAGWYVTEIGRQPWLVTGVLRTADAVTSLPTGNVGTSLVLYLLVYAGLLTAYVHTVRLLARKSVEVEEFEVDDHATHDRPLIEEGASS